MTTQSSYMDQTTLVNRIVADHPNIQFIPAKRLCWVPAKQQILYEIPNTEAGVWGLLHELGHAKLGHAAFQTDMDLITKEAQAWNAAVTLAERYDIAIPRDYIEGCLDTYRDWLHRRSTCPVCCINGLQSNAEAYVCLNCGTKWLVTRSRFCRPYRRQYKA